MWTLTTTKIYIAVALILLLALVSLGAGWQVRGWHDNSVQLKQARKDTADLQAGFAQVVKSNNVLADKITTTNHVTDTSMAQLVTAFGVQANAFNGVQVDLGRLLLGSCSFTPAADRLYQRAYEAAFGRPPDSAAEGRKTRRGHAAHH